MTLLEKLPAALAGGILIFRMIDLVGETGSSRSLVVLEDLHEPEITVMLGFDRVGLRTFNNTQQSLSSVSRTNLGWSPGLANENNGDYCAKLVIPIDFRIEN